MAITLNGTTGITSPAVDSEGGTDSFGNQVLFSQSDEFTKFIQQTRDFSFIVGATDIDGTNGKTALLINRDGDISFYEDTGTTAKLFWDASAEMAVIGDTGATAYGGGLAVATPTGSHITVADTGSGEQLHLRGGGGLTTIGSKSNHDLQIITNDTERMRIESGGNVGIGTTSPASKLDVNGTVTVGGSIGQIDLTNSTSSTPVILPDDASIRSFSGDVSTSAVELFGSASGRGGFAIVFGSSGTNRFVDYILIGRTSGSIQSSFNILGGSAARTYTITSFSTLNLTMASGTYDIRAVAFYPTSS